MNLPHLPTVHLAGIPRSMPKGGLHQIHIQPMGSGFKVTHILNAKPPKNFVFGSGSGMLNHLAKTTRSMWLGNKQGLPRLPSARWQKRAKEVSATSYAKPKASAF